MKSKKKYWVIAKVECSRTCYDRECVNCSWKKWRCNDLRKFADFLDQRHPGWRFFNVFEYRKDGKGLQITSFTKQKRPRNRFV